MRRYYRRPPSSTSVTIDEIELTKEDFDEKTFEAFLALNLPKRTIFGKDCWYASLEGSVSPGDPGCRTLANGDPGYPPTGPEVEFQVYLDKEDISNFLTEKKLDSLGDDCLQEADNQCNYDPRDDEDNY